MEIIIILLFNNKIKNSVTWLLVLTGLFLSSAQAADISPITSKSEETLNDPANDRGPTSISTGTAAGYEISGHDDVRGRTSHTMALVAANFSIQTITPEKVFTPAAALNNTIEFIFDNPDNAVVEGKIFDTRGAHIADMTAGSTSGSLLWDGKDSGGSIVRGGVYIYQVEASGAAAAIITGTVVAAR